MPSATARAHPNIALAKYWGKRDRALNLPATPSFSLTLAPYLTRTTVTWGAARDRLVLNGQETAGDEARKVFLALGRLDPDRPPCAVVTENNFPTAAGLASSASGFATLILAGAAAAELDLTPAQLAVHARRASGSATRSLDGGWVVWPSGVRPDGSDSHGSPVAPADWWDVRMVVAVVQAGPKAVGSTEAMLLTERSSPYYSAWVAGAPADVADAVRAVQDRDLAALGPVIERSAMRMHASMWAASPPIVYQAPGTIAALEAVRRLRVTGVAAWATMDAGPNVKVLCHTVDHARVVAALEAVVDRVEVLSPGGAAVVE